jgi:hypothetical protein
METTTSTTIRKFRWFWPWQDENEEAWLESMAETGWHLAAVQLFGKYTFRQGEPGHVAYRLDYMPTRNRTELEGYLQVFQDAGWNYVGEMSNWRYWRKAVQPGETAEIFTDNESKIRKYRRLLLFLGFIFFLLLFLGMNLFFNTSYSTGDKTVWQVFMAGVKLIYLVLYVIYIYIFIRLFQRMNQLKRITL